MLLRHHSIAAGSQGAAGHMQGARCPVAAFPAGRKQQQQQRTTASGSSRAWLLVAAAGNGALQETNVLVVGNGGREHALSWKLAQSPLCRQLFVAPGNPGIGEEPKVQNVPVDVTNHAAVVEFCKSNDIGLVLVGPEAPLVAGLADDLTAAGIRTFGPSAAAAQLEGSKKFMKDICKKYNIPTAAYESFTDPDAAKAYIRAQGAPIVVKTSGLAAGKGVIVASSVEEACQAVDDMMLKGMFGDAGAEVVVEEFLDGEEASFFALIDGPSAVPLASAQDHKAVGDGDTGPNTGGMGAYSPAPVVTPEIEKQVMEELVLRTAQAMVAEGIPFRGVLFAGLMIKNGKAKLLEHNVRFGDPECQGLMARLDSDLLAALIQACDGQLSQVQLSWKPQASLTVVLAAKGYPGAYKKGTPIRNLQAATSAKVFHAGTALNDKGQLVASGGRVLGVTALGADVAAAQAAAYEAVGKIDWEDAYFRKDIGWRAVARLKEGAAAAAKQ